ncbi:MAG TPA: DUF547 domain-containing protein [Longimicrobiales bacterium]
MTNRLRGALRHFAFSALFASTIAATAQAQSFDHSPFDAIVHTHSTGLGVDYAAIKADRASLDRYVAQLGTVSTSAFEKWPRADQIAFLLNAYNAIVIQQVIDDYPIERSARPAAMVRPANSVWQIDGFFDLLKHRVTDRALTLDQIEHEWLRPRFKEPRIHFALVCAAHSCPPLRREAYVAARLEAQLDDQARIFLNDRARNRFGEKDAQVSEIFKWFGSDFGTEQQLRTFLGRYLNPATAVRLRSDRYRINYLDYDWTLNDVAR